jgi:hypothetical protein
VRVDTACGSATALVNSVRSPAHFQHRWYLAKRKFPTAPSAVQLYANERVLLGRYQKSQVGWLWQAIARRASSKLNLQANAPLCRSQLDPQRDRKSHPRKRTVLRQPAVQAPRR